MSRGSSRSRVAGGKESIVMRIIILIIFTAVWWGIGWNILRIVKFPIVLRIIAFVAGEVLVFFATGSKGRARRAFIYLLCTIVAIIIWWFIGRWILYTLSFPAVARYTTMVVGFISTIIAYIWEIIEDDGGFWKRMLVISFTILLILNAMNYLFFHIIEV